MFHSIGKSSLKSSVQLTEYYSSINTLNYETGDSECEVAKLQTELSDIRTKFLSLDAYYKKMFSETIDAERRSKEMVLLESKMLREQLKHQNSEISYLRNKLKRSISPESINQLLVKIEQRLLQESEIKLKSCLRQWENKIKLITCSVEMMQHNITHTHTRRLGNECKRLSVLLKENEKKLERSRIDEANAMEKVFELSKKRSLIH